MIAKKRIRQLNLRLSLWHKNNKRPYPWRERNDLYSLLVVEILLQKTNADKVVPVYNRLIKKYPNTQALQNARLSTLRNIIKPLGLINKGATLKSMAKDLISIEQSGKVTKEELLAIRGIGDYITSSVLIHHTDNRIPLIDPNFIRILSRVFHIMSQLKRPRTDRTLWEQAEVIMPKRNISEYVYAMLDFGALVCRLSKPRCHECPMFDTVCDGAI